MALKTYLVCVDKEDGLLEVQEIGNPTGDLLRNFSKTEVAKLFGDWVKEMDRKGFTIKKSEISVSHFDGDLVDSWAIG